MAVLPIITAPHEVLTKKAEEVEDIHGKDITRLLTDLKDTLLSQKDPIGVGIAAPQVGNSLRVFIIRDEETDKISTFINPKILSTSKDTYADIHPEEEPVMEGCLSIPMVYGQVDRPNEIEIEYTGEDGRTHTGKFGGLIATYIQHEYDHVEGILFTTKVLSQGHKLFRVDNDKWREIVL